jgi:hypothetical protein
MADNNTDDFSLGANAFSIQDTMEMGMGNKELLNDFYASDAASATPEEIKPIIQEATPATPAEKPAKAKGKEVVPPEEQQENPLTKGQSLISNLLGNDEDEDEETEVLEKVGDEQEEKIEDSQETQFSALTNDLLKLGVFTTDEGETENPIKSGQDFLDRFQAEKRKGSIEMVDNFLGQFGQDYRDAFDAIYVKGVNPKDYFSAYNTIVNFAELDLSQEDNQVRVIRQALADQGFDSEDINTEVERLRNYGDLETVSARHHKVLIKKEAQKLQQMEAQAENELQQKALIKNQYVQNVQSVLTDKLKAKEFDGIPLNPKLAGELQDFLLTDKWKTASGETLTDFDRTILDLKKPENHAMKVKVALLLKILEKDPTLSTIQKSGVSKKTDVLFEQVARQVTPNKETGRNTPGTPSNDKRWFV